MKILNNIRSIIPSLQIGKLFEAINSSTAAKAALIGLTILGAAYLCYNAFSPKDGSFETIPTSNSTLIESAPLPKRPKIDFKENHNAVMNELLERKKSLHVIEFNNSEDKAEKKDDFFYESTNSTSTESDSEQVNLTNEDLIEKPKTLSTVTPKNKKETLPSKFKNLFKKPKPPIEQLKTLLAPLEQRVIQEDFSEHFKNNDGSWDEQKLQDRLETAAQGQDLIINGDSIERSDVTNLFQATNEYYLKDKNRWLSFLCSLQQGNFASACIEVHNTLKDTDFIQAGASGNNVPPDIRIGTYTNAANWATSSKTAIGISKIKPNKITHVATMLLTITSTSKNKTFLKIEESQQNLNPISAKRTEFAKNKALIMDYFKTPPANQEVDPLLERINRADKDASKEQTNKDLKRMELYYNKQLVIPDSETNDKALQLSKLYEGDGEKLPFLARFQQAPLNLLANYINNTLAIQSEGRFMTMDEQTVLDKNKDKVFGTYNNDGSWEVTGERVFKIKDITPPNPNDLGQTFATITGRVFISSKAPNEPKFTIL